MMFFGDNVEIINLDFESHVTAPAMVFGSFSVPLGKKLLMDERGFRAIPMGEVSGFYRFSVQRDNECYPGSVEDLLVLYWSPGNPFPHYEPKARMVIGEQNQVVRLVVERLNPFEEDKPMEKWKIFLGAELWEDR